MKKNVKTGLYKILYSTPLHKTPLKTIFMVIFCTLFTSTGQILWKFGSASVNGVASFILNPLLLLGFVCYGLGAVLLIISLKYGELSVVYPFFALSFIWVNIMSMYIFHEAIATIHWFGILGILLGISFIGYGSGK